MADDRPREGIVAALGCHVVRTGTDEFLAESEDLVFDHIVECDSCRSYFAARTCD